nr:uncharacterized protein LOC113740655 [Coffea arabica]
MPGEVTFMDLMVEDKKKEAVTRQNRRLKKQLRSPTKRRTPLKEICTNTKDSGVQGKRKFQLCDEEMEDAEGKEIGGKRNKGCLEVVKDRKKLWGEQWIIAGDFNDILSNEEKWGGRWREEKSFTDFNNFINDNQLIDIGFEGNLWTWSNNWEDVGEVRERLNRGLCSIDWSLVFDKAKCKHVDTFASNHSMLMIDTRKRKRRFYFDKRWLKREGIQDVIRNAWEKDCEGSRMFRVKCKIRNCRIELLKWKNNSNCNAKKKIIQIKSQLEKLQSSTHYGTRKETVSLKEQLKEAYKKKELYWHQKARLNWIKKGDKNTKFFHAQVKGRRRRNRMLNLQREDGSWTENEQELGEEVANYYKQLFTSNWNGSPEEILRGIPSTITASMNDQLARGVDEEEIRTTIFSMSPDTAPGMDDDSLIFCKANTKQTEELRRILVAYEKSSGQLINLEKSSVFFSKNMDHGKKLEVCCRLGNIQMVNQGKYLGLPMVITRTKDQIFGFIRDNIKKNFGSWKQRLLSQAGKEVLLKAMTIAMPTYTMSCFKLPLKLCKEISALMASYWWGDTNGKEKMHQCSWKRISQNKNQGGLGFKDLVNFNRALLGKQIWRLLVNPNLLISKVLKAKYYPTGSFFNCKCPQNASWIWQSLMGAKQFVEEGTWRKIGNGCKTDIWEDKWIIGNKEGRPSTPKPPECKVQKVQDLIIQKRWNRVEVFRTFNSEDAERILSIPISLAGKEDNNFWIHSPTGQYKVSTRYKVRMKEKETQERVGYKGAGPSTHNAAKQMWSCLWKLNIKQKLKTFMWKCINNSLSVKEVIFSRTKKEDPIYKACGEGVETVKHMLLNCRQAKQDGEEHLGLTVNILWQVWKSRNEWEFNNKQRHAMTTIKKAQEEWMEFCEAYKQKEQVSTAETTANQMPRIEEENAEVIQVKIAALSKPNSKEVGIGVTTMTEGNVIVAAWAIHEKSYNCPQLDEAEAIKIVMSKLVVKGWRKVNIQSCNKHLHQQISATNASNIKLHTLVEDILSLKALFQMCSFGVISKNNNHVNTTVGEYALGIIHDEEWINPLCY